MRSDVRGNEAILLFTTGPCSYWVNPKFCVKSILGENRAMFIWGGSKGNRLPPFQEHNADGGRMSRAAKPFTLPLTSGPGGVTQAYARIEAAGQYLVRDPACCAVQDRNAIDVLSVFLNIFCCHTLNVHGQNFSSALADTGLQYLGFKNPPADFGEPTHPPLRSWYATSCCCVRCDCYLLFCCTPVPRPALPPGHSPQTLRWFP